MGLRYVLYGFVIEKQMEGASAGCVKLELREGVATGCMGMSYESERVGGVDAGCMGVSYKMEGVAAGSMGCAITRREGGFEVTVYCV